MSSDAEYAKGLAEVMVQESKKQEDEDLELARKLHEQTTGTTATDFTCSLCIEEFCGASDLNKGVVTKCDHKFCMVCFMKYIDTREKQISEQMEKHRNAAKVERDIKCPLCRESIVSDANRIRRLHNKPPVYIPDHPAPNPRAMTWDPAMSVIVVCNRCNQRLYAPPGKVVKCVCKNLIQPQNSQSIWRKDSQVMKATALSPDQAKVTLVICPGCRRNFTARMGETVRCQCGTGLFVPVAPQQQRGSANPGHGTA
eukprot:TRINITY_DN30534_c0_g1_i2.p1 TRINITY_DN30534_c0_g1~~TRINITY_DN30534_c0_g1_i2.p1  ORF type:complete len:255 (+),score=102.42 TRINITY_DN30534_c0_g1_i2:261-1025(+)